MRTKEYRQEFAKHAQTFSLSASFRTASSFLGDALLILGSLTLLCCSLTGVFSTLSHPGWVFGLALLTFCCRVNSGNWFPEIARRSALTAGAFASVLLLLLVLCSDGAWWLKAEFGVVLMAGELAAHWQFIKQWFTREEDLSLLKKCEDGKPHLSHSSNESNDEDPSVTQEMLRRETADADTIEGTIKTQMPFGSKSQTVNLVFCPAFATTPSFEVEQLDGPEVRLNVAQVLPNGARIELKLTSGAADYQPVQLAFFAFCGKCQREVA